MTLIVPHIPKSGGTSIAVQVTKGGSSRVFLDYKAPPGRLPHHQDRMLAMNRWAAEQDFSSYAMVFGHFPVSRYAGPDYRYAVLVRDPLKRAISEYNYLIKRRKAGVKLAPNSAKLADKLISGELSFARWVHNGKIGVYNLYLHYWPAGRFSLIGVMDRYADYCGRLSELTGIDIDAGVRERSVGGEEPAISGPDRKLLDQALADDYAWYNTFVRAAV